MEFPVIVFGGSIQDWAGRYWRVTEEACFKTLNLSYKHYFLTIFCVKYEFNLTAVVAVLIVSITNNQIF